MPDKINATRFCDLQGVNDFDRDMIERKYYGLTAFLDEWYNTLKKEGFELHPLQNFPQYMKNPPPADKDKFAGANPPVADKPDIKK